MNNPFRDKQNFWNFIFSVIFAVLLFIMTFKLAWWHRGNFIMPKISLGDFLLMSLAVFRLIRLFSYDKITQFARDIFLDIEYDSKGEIVSRIKPAPGFRRTVVELLDCPWCTGVWVTLFVAFFYLWTPVSHFAVMVLAVAGVATLFQLSANAIGWTAENLKQKTQSK